MPAHLKALIVILILAAPILALAKAPACALAVAPADFDRRRNLWFAVTLAAFLAHNYWVYVLAVAALLALAALREPNRLAMYFFVLFAVPAIPAQVGGLGLVNFFFVMDYYRLLALALLLPAYLALRGQPGAVAFGRLMPDKLLLAYLVLNFVLRFNVDSFTNTLRYGAFYAFIDAFLPYYVASRSLRTLPAFRDTLMSFTFAALVLGAIAVFEFGKHWLLYSSLDHALGEPWDYGRYLMRGAGVLRAQGSAGHAIPLGYAMAVAIGLFLYARSLIASRLVRSLGLALLLAGLVAPVSRGPWVGAAAIVMVFIATGPAAMKRFAQLGLAGLVLLPAVLASPYGEALVNYLPFIGTVETENIAYRERLLEVSLQVMMQNPVFGSPSYLDSAGMQSLIQGQGIIDMVNTYLGVGLASGLVGLSLFAGFFAAVCVSIVQGMKRADDRDGERYLLGRALLATLLGILLIIFTVSSVTLIPVIYWAVAGMGVAYAAMLARERAVQPAPVLRDVGPYPAGGGLGGMRTRRAR